MTSGISDQVRKSSESKATAKLLRMLQSTSAKYPSARLVRRQAGFGVLLGEGRYLLISTNGDLAPEDMRDLLVLFAAWLVVDADELRRPSTGRSGS